MCRMFGYTGAGREDLEMLFEALKVSAYNDDSSDKIRQHPDGWGYVILSGNGLFHYRSRSPVYEDSFRVPDIVGKFLAIFHARKASKNSPVGSQVYSHPFSHYGGSRVVFLAHNGSLKGQYPGKVDSEVALEIVSSNDGDLAKAEYELKRRMKSAINMLVLSFEKEKPLEATLKYLNFWNRDEGEERFYQMYTAKMPNGNAVMSSTIAFRLGIDGTAPCKTGITEVLA